MDIRQLRYFLAVAREGQVTSAAKRLNMEQPPLSRQMKMLEQELGVTLFDRSGKRLTLTHAGELLRERAERLLQQFDETVQEVRELDEGIQGVLSIGSVVSCVSLLPRRIERFRQQFPGVTFKIREGDHFLLGEQMEKRNIELVIARLPFEAASDPERYSVLPLPPDPFVALLPDSWSPASAEPGIDMRELAQYPFITLKSDQTTGMHAKVLKEFRQSGLEPRILCECSSVAITIALVAAGIGATILPKSVTASFPLTNISTFPIANADFHSENGIVWLRDRYLSKTARRFIDMFQDLP
ncbi:LysR family transcriptional regulator [Cohnella sp. CFH 77786]|uniref:LysR family transcriptional regulator n=1 Tax=Cohnella sp. CFH 77786 TaxID=2662265 RepID=UPI001C60C01D|nr:LysR family transcriptional regulator [Cohnella sp. CFH 77786]MBW5445802.1 LysR family transcriptional regulator [Cohnella sp. CFH 77786]